MNSRLTHQVAIVGAGPYGLAAAAHLRAAKVETCVFGKAMDFWDRQMPEGMLLRSCWEASHISDPHRALTLDRYCASQNVSVSKPIPLNSFVNYGRWFQQQTVPDLDQRSIVEIDTMPGGFRLSLEDGDVVQVQRVVVAAGIARFARKPAEFEGLPHALVSHTSEYRSLAPFAGMRVAVIGGGQSALESAALLHEAGADVEVLVRRPGVHWLEQKLCWLKSESNPFRRIFYPPTDVGPIGLNWIVATPALFRCFPSSLQEKIAYRSIRPAGSGWLIPRVEKVPITTGRCVVAASPDGNKLKLHLDDGTERTVDHALLATGYRVDVSQYGFLAPSLLKTLQVIEGYPKLKAGLESVSIPGLHFTGAPAAKSFGPVCRFVSGTTFCAGELARRIQGKPMPHSSEPSPALAASGE